MVAEDFLRNQQVRRWLGGVEPAIVAFSKSLPYDAPAMRALGLDAARLAFTIFR